MDGWAGMVGCLDGWINEWMPGRMDGGMHGLMDVQIAKCTGGRMYE